MGGGGNCQRSCKRCFLGRPRESSYGHRRLYNQKADILKSLRFREGLERHWGKGGTKVGDIRGIERLRGGGLGGGQEEDVSACRGL